MNKQLNNLSKVIAKLSILSKISSTNDKKAFLLDNIDDEDFYAIINILLNPKIILNVKTIQLTGKYTESNNISLEEFIELVHKLQTNNINKKLRTEIHDLLSCTYEEMQKILIKILTKSLKIGVTASTVNKIKPNFLPEFKCMLATTGLPKSYPVYVDTKWDGVRCLAEVVNNKCTIWSRKGNKIPIKALEAEFVRLANGHDLVFDGELLDSNRKEVSGKINSIMKTGETSDANSIYVRVFDVLDAHEFFNQIPNKTSLAQRILTLSLMIAQAKPSRIIMSIGRKADDELHMKNIINNLIENGEEGAIVKELDASYEYKRSNNWLKFKAINTTTLEVIDVKEGKNSREGDVGALICRTSCGNLEVDVGSGIKHDDLPLLRGLVGKYVEVLFNVMISDAKGNLSLFLPRLKSNDWLRIDKTEADSVVKILSEHIGKPEISEELLVKYTEGEYNDS